MKFCAGSGAGYSVHVRGLTTYRQRLALPQNEKEEKTWILEGRRDHRHRRFLVVSKYRRSTVQFLERRISGTNVHDFSSADVPLHVLAFLNKGANFIPDRVKGCL